MCTVHKMVLYSNIATQLIWDKSFPVSILKRQIAVLFLLCQLSLCKASYSTGESLREQGLKYSLRLQVSQGCSLQNKNAFALIAIAVNSVETVVVLEPSSGSLGKISLFCRPSTLFSMKIDNELCIHYPLTQEEAKVMPCPSCVWS